MSAFSYVQVNERSRVYAGDPYRSRVADNYAITMVDPLSLQVFANLFSSVAEEMGVAMQRAAHSPNITMRRDFSCAVFDADGQMLAQAAHIPVHLGAMPLAMRAVRDTFELGPGDVAILNDPYRGGT